MKTEIKLSENSGLNKFSSILSDAVANVLSSAIGDSVSIDIQQAFYTDAQNLAENYESQALVMATEGTSIKELGFFFHISDITSVVDIMLLGDGASQQELDEDNKDAIKELVGQMVGAMVVPIETDFSAQLQFRVDDVETYESPEHFVAEQYIAFNMSAMVQSRAIPIRFYMDSYFESIFKEDEEPIVMDFFEDLEDKPQRQFDFSDSPNMDMLLDIDIPVSIRMGSTRLFLKDILGLGPGNIVELDQNADEMVQLFVNDKMVARGEVVLVDGYFGFRIREIISKADRIRQLKD